MVDINSTEVINQQELIDLFIFITSKGKKANTYKFALAKFLLDFSKRTTELNDTKISYNEISNAFLKYYWFQECKYKIKQDFQKDTQPVIISIIQKYCGNEYIADSYDKYFKKENFKHDMTKEIENRCLNDVIPRFQPDALNLFYTHNHKRVSKKYKVPNTNERFIILNKNAILFLKKNYELLHKTLILEWAKFLEKTNFTPKLISKIENLGASKRRSLNTFKKILLKSDSSDCFYCNKPLDSNDIHVDHFIPWSYVYDDEIWNLVLSCSSCNLKKSDYLASEDKLLKLENRNIELDLIKPNKDVKEFYYNCKKAGFLQL